MIVDLPAENEILIAAHQAADPLVRAARALGGLPRPNSLEFVEADIARRQGVLVVCGLAYLVAEPEQRIRAAMADAGAAIAAAVPKSWLTDHLPADRLAARRALPATRPGDYPGGAVAPWGPEPTGRPAA